MMRVLSLVELEEEIDNQFNSINCSQLPFVQDKLNNFLFFLHNQPISKRILERITEDFAILKSKLPPAESTNPSNRPKVHHKIISEVKQNINDTYDQGAFGFFIIQELYEIERKFEKHYLNSAELWYDEPIMDYDEGLDWFKEKFFIPFVNLLKWYIYESTVKSGKDYYSKNEIIEINQKLDAIQKVHEASSELIFEEIQELKELILFLNKKNWAEVVKGKVTDTAFGLILSENNISGIFNNLLDTASNLLK